MYTTKQAIKILLDKSAGLTFVMSSNRNIHIFKDINGFICRGEYGNGSIDKLSYESYPFELWEIDFYGSKFRG